MGHIILLNRTGAETKKQLWRKYKSALNFYKREWLKAGNDKNKFKRN